MDTEIVSATLSDLIRRSFNAVMEGASKQATLAWSKIFEDFEPYMRSAHSKNSSIRIISKKDCDVNLYDIYVSGSYLFDDDVITSEELIYKVQEGCNIVLVGDGGAGKTIFMRHLWMNLFNHSARFTPIFLELRNINSLSKIDFGSFIRRSISIRKELSEDIFDYFCDLGKFCFIFDGFDEVSEDLRESLQQELLYFSDKYPDCSFVVSSRYDKRFAGWQSFQAVKSSPFTLGQVKELVQKVPFDRSAKKSFIKVLGDDFYEKHKEFLSNPLLALMMLMNYRENMEVPDKMNIFYDQAFTTLYQWHDATKAFNRKKRLDIDDFQRSFGVFSLMSYYNEKYEFSKTEIIDYISKSNKVCSIEVPEEEVLSDYEHSVNLIRQEGMDYIFIHRSFQEYFAAYALVKVVPAKLCDFIDKFETRHFDNVISLAFSMDKNLVSKKYIEPNYDAVVASVKRRRPRNSKYYYLSHIVRELSFNFNVLRSSDTSKLSSISISITFGEGEDCPFAFISAVLKIGHDGRSNQERALYRYLMDVIGGHNGILQFLNLGTLIRSATSFKLIIQFSADHYDIVLEGVEEDQEEVDSIQDKSPELALKSSRLKELDERFMEMEAVVEKQFKDCMNICEDEIGKIKGAGQSIEDILSL